MQIYFKGNPPEYVFQKLREMDFADKGYVLEIKEATRSSQQNRYRWAMVEHVRKIMNAVLKKKNLPLASKEDIDLYIKEQALGIVHRIPTKHGELIIQGKLKTKTKAEFEEYMEQIRAWGAEHGIIIPIPNEDNYG